MIEVHLQGGGVIRLQKIGVGYYQVAHTNYKGETKMSPLFIKWEEAVKWAILLIAQASSPSKAGT